MELTEIILNAVQQSNLIRISVDPKFSVTQIIESAASQDVIIKNTVFDNEQYGIIKSCAIKLIDCTKEEEEEGAKQELQKKIDVTDDLLTSIAATYFDALANLLGHVPGRERGHQYRLSQREAIAIALQDVYRGLIKDAANGEKDAILTTLKNIGERLKQVTQYLGAREFKHYTITEIMDKLRSNYNDPAINQGTQLLPFASG